MWKSWIRNKVCSSQGGANYSEQQLGSGEPLGVSDVRDMKLEGKRVSCLSPLFLSGQYGEQVPSENTSCSPRPVLVTQLEAIS